MRRLLPVIRIVTEDIKEGVNAANPAQIARTVRSIPRGGAHFIKPNDLTGKGEAVSIDSLVKKQFFDQGIGNLNQAQMRATNHVIVFQITDKTFAAITPKASGKIIQKHLLAAGVQTAIKFDGGSGRSGYDKLSNTNICPTRGANPSGLCIN